MNNEQIINKVIEETTKRLKNKQSVLVFDNTPTEGSNNPVTSDGIKKYMDSKPSGGTNIEINPKSSGSKNLNSIGIDNTKYKIETGTKVQGNVEVSGVSVRLKGIRVNGTSYNFPEEKNISTVIPKSTKSELNKFSNKWETKSWSGYSYIFGRYIWTDGDNIYLSNGTTQYILDKSTSTWNEKTWIGLTNFDRAYIWTDGENIYYSRGTDHYVLDKASSTWSQKTWNGLNIFSGDSVWTDGTNIYYSYSSNQYVLDKTTSTWSQKTWYGLTNFSGSNIWTDGENIYYSSGNLQYVLDKTTSTWSQKEWTGLTELYGNNIWTDKESIYYSNGIQQYVLDKKTFTWITKTWNENNIFDGDNIWTDGENVYLSNAGGAQNSQYVLKKNTLPQIKPVLSDELTVKANPELSGSEEELTGIQIENNIYKMPEQPVVSNVIPKNVKTELNKFSNTWENKEWYGQTWDGDNNPMGEDIWTDGENVYYSFEFNEVKYQYVLNKETSTWETKVWNITIRYGRCVWTDGDNVYYSDSTKQYFLNKSTLTWSQKSWTNLTNFSGDDVWTDGENIYYSSSSNQYVLNKSTSTWNVKSWTGLTDFQGQYIWTDGDNIYYSAGSIQYVLDKSTSTWTRKIWTGLTNFYNHLIWSDGENIYYSSGSINQYVLDKETSTWSTKTWNGNPDFDGYGNDIWSDNKNIYLSNGFSQYILSKNQIISTKPVLSDNTSVKVNDNSAYSEDQLHTLTVNGTLYKVGFDSDILIVNGLSNTSNVVSWTAPDLTYFTDCNPQLSYLVYVNNTLVDTITTTSIDVSSYLVSGDNTVRIKVKINATNPTGESITVVK